MAQLRLTSPAEYLARLDEQPAEAHVLADLFLVGTTEAFRDASVFDALRTELLPELVRARLATRARRLRIWSAGTSTGEEAFSLATLATVVADGKLEIDVLGTDVSAVALERAARGRVRADKLHGVPKEFVERFFLPSEDDATRAVAPELRDRVTFARHDLLDPTRIAPTQAVVASFDVVACRNVLIYLKTEAVVAVLTRLLKVCSAGGLLVLGSAEQLPNELADLAVQVHPGVPIFLRRTD